jgi:hypothetical protein
MLFMLIAMKCQIAILKFTTLGSIMIVEIDLSFMLLAPNLVITPSPWDGIITREMEGGENLSYLQTFFASLIKSTVLLLIKNSLMAKIRSFTFYFSSIF